MIKIKVGDFAKYNHTNGVFGRVIDIYKSNGVLCCSIKALDCDINVTYHLALKEVIKLTRDEIIMELL